MSYVELQVTTNFSFLMGASHPEELVERASDLGFTQIGITDRNSLAGIVRAHAKAREKNIRIIPACRLDLSDGPPLLAYPTNKLAYAQISAMITKGNLRTEKGKCILYKEDIFEKPGGIKFIAVPPLQLNTVFNFEPDFEKALREYKDVLGKDLYIAASRLYHGNDTKRLHRIHQLSQQLQIPMVATNDVYYHETHRRQLQDVVTCIREKCTIHTAGFRLQQNAERFLKSEKEMKRLFNRYPDAITRTMEIAETCTFCLQELKYEYPHEITGCGRSQQEELAFQAWKGAKEYFGESLPEKIVASINHELKFIEEMNYATYFLFVYDIVCFAKRNQILCQGRGSAANSTVCFCLGITSVNPTKFDLLFERFVSAARNEPPDIDVDFEHERREEVMQYVYSKYGRDRAGIVATVIQQRQKGATRDVGKAMGLSVDIINRLTSTLWEFSDEWLEGQNLEEQGLNPHDKLLKKVLQLTGEFMGFPRQLGQHTGGFVITDGKLSDLCPILNARMEDRTCIEWNKDDIDALGFLKVDLLALGMLTCIRKCFDLTKAHYERELTLSTVPQDDPDVYEMIGHADTIGVFQIESRAQQAMLPRMKPKNFYDLVIEVAIVRPGPIQGDMVHPYLRRRNGLEPTEYPSKEIEEITKRTNGVPLFQEQAMKIAIVAAGFSATEADALRRSMATFKAQGQVKKFKEKLISGMVNNGYKEDYAERVFKQLEGFGSYGFPESHAASFANLVYISSWIKYHMPEVFACGLLNSMPMGFYQPAQIIIDAKKHGVDVRPIDINYSNWDNLLEEKSGKYFALRLGFRQVKSLREEDMQLLIEGRKTPFTNINQLRDVGLSKATLEKLADADAFRSIGLDRRQALWEISCNDVPIALFKGQTSGDASEKKVSLPAMSVSEHVVEDYAATSLSLKAHPVSFIREKLKRLNIISASELIEAKDGDVVKVAGLVLIRQRPGTANGICFITIEDETGCANLVVFPNLFDEYRKEILQSRLLMVQGKLQKEGEVIHVITQQCFDLTKLLRSLTASQNENLPILTLSRADEKSEPIPSYPNKNKKREVPNSTQKKIFPDARNFK